MKSKNITMSKFTPPTLLFFQFLLASLVVAQTPSAPVQPEIPVIKFRSLALEKTIKRELYYNDGSDYESLQLSHYRPSLTRKGRLDNSGNLLIFNKSVNAEGVEVYNVANRVAIPSNSRRVLLLSIEQDNTVIFKAVDDNLSANDREWLFINASRTQLALQLGEGNSPFSLPPSQAVPYEVQVQPGTGSQIQVAAFDKDDGWKKIYSTYWPIYEKQRGLVICIEINGKIVVKRFFDAVVDD